MTREDRKSSQARPTLVLGATGKTGRRVAARLQALGRSIRIGSRGASPAFDWTHAKGWDACLEGIAAVYVNYPSDLPIPGRPPKDFSAFAREIAITETWKIVA